MLKDFLVVTCTCMKFFVLKSSFSSLHSSIQDTEMFDDLNSLVTRSNVNAHHLFHSIMLFQFDLCFEVLY